MIFTTPTEGLEGGDVEGGVGGWIKIVEGGGINFFTVIYRGNF